MAVDVRGITLIPFPVGVIVIMPTIHITAARHPVEQAHDHQTQSAAQSENTKPTSHVRRLRRTGIARGTAPVNSSADHKIDHDPADHQQHHALEKSEETSRPRGVRGIVIVAAAPVGVFVSVWMGVLMSMRAAGLLRLMRVAVPVIVPAAFMLVLVRVIMAASFMMMRMAVLPALRVVVAAALMSAGIRMRVIVFLTHGWAGAEMDGLGSFQASPMAKLAR